MLQGTFVSVPNQHACTAGRLSSVGQGLRSWGSVSIFTLQVFACQYLDQGCSLERRELTLENRAVSRRLSPHSSRGASNSNPSILSPGVSALKFFVLSEVNITEPLPRYEKSYWDHQRIFCGGHVAHRFPLRINRKGKIFAGQATVIWKKE